MTCTTIFLSGETNEPTDNSVEVCLPVLPLEGLLRINTIVVHYQVSKAQLYQEIQEGVFPKQIKIGRSSFWGAVEFRRFLKKHGANVVELHEEEVK